MPDETLRIAVCDAASAYRRGLGAALTGEGYAVHDAPADAGTPAPTGVDGVLVTVRSANDWQALRDVVAANPAATVVALVVDPTPDRHAEALRCGAHGAVAWEAAPETILRVLRAALDGMVLLPAAVARAVAASGPALYDAGWVTEEEVGWLQLLANGATVQQLAEKVGYSERAVYRMLHGLYGRMRVSSRTEAVLQASRWGLLADDR